jgi:hypothetical protein
VSFQIVWYNIGIIYNFTESIMNKQPELQLEANDEKLTKRSTLRLGCCACGAEAAEHYSCGHPEIGTGILDVLEHRNRAYR